MSTLTAAPPDTETPIASPPNSTMNENQPPSKRRSSQYSYIHDPTLSTLHSILHEPRLTALHACDSSLLTYNPQHWRMVLQPHGRNLTSIFTPLLSLLLWETVWIVLLQRPKLQHVKLLIGNLNALISPLLVPVSFLLVFRLGRAAVRFWDARAACGKIVETCRVLVSTVAAACACSTASSLNQRIATSNDNDTQGEANNDNAKKIHREIQTNLEEMAKWTCVFPITVKNFLRPSKRKKWHPILWDDKRRLELGPLLNDDDAKLVLNVDENNRGPIVVLNRLRHVACKLCMGLSQTNQNLPTDMLYHQWNTQINTLTGAWGACERIHSTPLPLVYVLHLRTFLLLYLLLWTMEAAATHGWVGLPTTIMASWGLLGIEAAAVECERPFQWHGNHLALGGMGVTVARNVGQTLREFGFGGDG